MEKADRWGRDPAVRMMRVVFGRAEAAQNEFLRSNGISPLDGRLRSWREKTLKVFERGWTEIARRGVHLDEHAAASLYIHLLGKTMASDGLRLPPEGDSEVERILREAGL